MIARSIWIALAFGLLGATAASAQDVSDYVRLAPRPDWVVPVSVPETLDAESADGRERVWPLVDSQTRFARDDAALSYRYVVDLLSSSAVEDEGTISLDFDPLYEQLDLNHVRLTRDGRELNAIDLSEAMVFRTETDRDQMIFNGTLTFSMPILDLRVGDRLDVAYTRSGRNPAVGKSVFARRSFDSTSDVKRRFVRVVVPSSQAIFTRSIEDVVEPEVTRQAGWTTYLWDAPDPQQPDYDRDVPAWTYLRPTFELSSFETWGDVGDLFAPSYAVNAAARAAVADIVADIAAEHDTPKARTRAALDWVQTHIRYVGLELGEGGFVPRQPERVLRRRFGDCKDVTVLLLALLDGLGIEADPILVNMDERGGEFLGLPNPYAFDHVKVVAEIDGALYPLDATRNPQTGTLDTMEKGDIASGLRMGEGGSAIVELPSSDYAFREIVTETFDLVSDPDAILYTLVMEEYGEDADATLSWIASDGEADVVDGYVRYLRDIYPTLESDGMVQIETDASAAMTRLTFEFRLPGYGGDGREKLETRAFQILGVTPSFEGGSRTAPFALNHPERVRHVRTYVGDNGYSFTAQSRVVETDAFRFEMEDIVDGRTLTEDYRWISKTDHIVADRFEADMALIDEVNDLNYTTLTLNKSVSSRSEESTTSPLALAAAWIVLLGFPGGVLFLIFGRRGRRKVNGDDTPVVKSREAYPNAS
ncbi:MAG: DUF3857 domain-containing protein [Litorimonas sp.]